MKTDITKYEDKKARNIYNEKNIENAEYKTIAEGWINDAVVFWENNMI